MNRIDQLENLVKRLIAERQDGSGNAPNTPESSTLDDNKAVQGAHLNASEVACAGTTMIDGTRSVYRGGDEWYDVLEEVKTTIFFLSLLRNILLSHACPVGVCSLLHRVSLLSCWRTAASFLTSRGLP